MYNTLFVGFGAIAYGLGLNRKYAEETPIPTHFAAVQDSRLGVVTSVLELSVERANAAQAAGVPWVRSDVTDLPNLAEIEVVSFLAGPQHEKEPVLDALPHLKGAVFEKPIGGTPSEINTLSRLLAEKDVAAQICYPRRFDKSMQNIKREVKEGILGEIQAVNVVYGNGIKNNGSHLIDLIRYLLGDLSLSGIAQEHFSSHTLENDLNANFCLRSRVGTNISFQCVDFKHYRENSIDIWGTKGRILLAQEGSTVHRWEVIPSRFGMGLMEIDSSAPTVERTYLGTSLSEVYRNLYGALQGKEEIISTMENAFKTESLIHEIVESAGR